MDYKKNYSTEHVTVDDVIAQNNKRISEHKKKQGTGNPSNSSRQKGSPKKSNKKKNKTGIGIIIFRIISLVIIIVCTRVLLVWHNENKSNNEVISSLQDDTNIKRDSIDVDSIEGNSEENSTTDGNNNDEENGQDENSEDSIQLVSTNFEDLLSKNSDTVGWIYIANTNINFPIVKTTNNNFYLKHNFKKEYNSAGWIFGDYRNNFDELDQNTIVYGHNRRNGTMFSNLKKYLNSSFAKRNSARYFSFNTVNQRYVAKVYSVYKMSSAKLILSNNYENDEEYEKFINEAKAFSIYDYDTEVSTDDKTLTLCTCDDNTAFRIVIHAKLIPIDAQGNENNNEQDNQEENSQEDSQRNNARNEDDE